MKQFYADPFAIQPVFRAAVSIAASGNNTLVAATTGSKIRVHQIVLVPDAAVTVKFQSGASGTDLTGAMALTTIPMCAGFDPYGHFETAASALLNVVLGGAVGVRGWVVYSLVPTVV
jgi:hypothetical protein